MKTMKMVMVMAVAALSGCATTAQVQPKRWGSWPMIESHIEQVADQIAAAKTSADWDAIRAEQWQIDEEEAWQQAFDDAETH